MGRQEKSYHGLLLLSTLLSIQMAQGLTNEELTLLSSFFEVLGDNLALLALRQEASHLPDNG